MATPLNIPFQGAITKELLKLLLPDNPLIIECGAHQGRDTLKMSKLWPMGTIHALEPVPHLFNLLKETTKNAPNVRCYQQALSATTGKQVLYVSSGASDACSSLLKPADYFKETRITFDTTVEVDTYTLDEWCQKNSIAQIDFMWLDMQGPCEELL